MATVSRATCILPYGLSKPQSLGMSFSYKDNWVNMLDGGEAGGNFSPGGKPPARLAFGLGFGLGLTFGLIVDSLRPYGKVWKYTCCATDSRHFSHTLPTI